jgi:hypothetical protein
MKVFKDWLRKLRDAQEVKVALTLQWSDPIRTPLKTSKYSDMALSVNK